MIKHIFYSLLVTTKEKKGLASPFLGALNQHKGLSFFSDLYYELFDAFLIDYSDEHQIPLTPTGYWLKSKINFFKD